MTRNIIIRNIWNTSNVTDMKCINKRDDNKNHIMKSNKQMIFFSILFYYDLYDLH